MKPLPTLQVDGVSKEVVIKQGGMGAGISWHVLAGAVAALGGIGTLSSVAMQALVEFWFGEKLSVEQAMAREVQAAREIAPNGFIAVNIMQRLEQDYRDSVVGAVLGGADAIVCSAGVHLDIPNMIGSSKIGLLLKVSSLRGLRSITKKWERKGRKPDAVVLEGPQAGGHVGFKLEDIPKEEFQLEQLFPEIKRFAEQNGAYPVIVAGGIFSHEDVLYWINQMGADGVSLGTRFAGSVESGGTEEYKRSLILATDEDIVPSYAPGSPCGLPFWVIKSCPLYQAILRGDPNPKCRWGYVLHRDKDQRYTQCSAKDGLDFCICCGLMGTSRLDPSLLQLYTAGKITGPQVKVIQTVREIMEDLVGHAL